MIRKLAFGTLFLLMGACAAFDEDLEESEQGESNPVVVSNVSDGTYVIKSVATGKCIDVAGAKKDDGGRIQEYSCNGTVAQKFRITSVGGGAFKIINVNSGKALDIKGVSTAENAVVHQWAYVGGQNQQFSFVNRGGTDFSIHARHTNMVLDLSWGKADDGTPILQYPWHDTSNQRWRLDKVDGGGGDGGGGGSATGFGAIISESQFNAMFPSRNGFYTYQALADAAATFNGFATTGDADTRKREVAAFLANVAHETGNLVYIEEIAKSTLCDTSWGPPGCGCAAGKQYYGRGPIQLSWNGNYCAAGNAIGIDLKNDPDRVARDATVAWRTGLWFWNTQTGAGSMTPHSAIVNGRGFGETVRSINGALECNGGRPDQVQSRINSYNRFLGVLGVGAVGTQGC